MFFHNFSLQKMTYTLNKKIRCHLGQIHMHSDIFETGDFLQLFSKIYVSTRNIVESFSPVHMKTLNNANMIAPLTEHG